MAQKVKTVRASYVYYASENTTIQEAKRIALERAKIQAITEHYGTIISQSNLTSIHNRNNVSNMDFYSLSSSEIEGEWIETIEEPIYDIFYKKEMLVVKVSVKGRIKRINRNKISLDVRVLCNGTDLKYERTDFCDGDDLYLYVQSPVDGYLNVYLLDEISQTGYCLLPYKKESCPSVQIRHDIPYVFFSREKNASISVDEYTMTCNREEEYNELYIIFSPHPFVKVNSLGDTENLPKELSYKGFHKWLHESQGRDKDMVVDRKGIKIKKREGQ